MTPARRTHEFAPPWREWLLQAAWFLAIGLGATLGAINGGDLGSALAGAAIGFAIPLAIAVIVGLFGATGQWLIAFALAATIVWAVTRALLA